MVWYLCEIMVWYLCVYSRYEVLFGQLLYKDGKVLLWDTSWVIFFASWSSVFFSKKIHDPLLRICLQKDP
jgi:hypothetical protein